MNSYYHQILSYFCQTHYHLITKCASNTIPKPEYLYLPKSVFSVNLTAPNKEYRNAKSLPTLNDHRFIS